MRIIAGSVKGRSLKTLRGKGTRPTSDRVKESLFAILGDRVSGADALDLYAGSGSLGIEALSRGAKSATFIDNYLPCIKTIKENLCTLGLVSKGKVYKQDGIAALQLLAKRKAQFNLIFIDPPYGSKLAEKTLHTLPLYNLIEDGATVVVEHSRRVSIVRQTGGFKLKMQRSYGGTMLSFYERDEKP